MNEHRTSSGERSLLRQHHGVTQTSRPTSAGRRGLVERSTPLDHLSLAPEGHPAEANEHWTTSSTPSARTTRIYATPCGTAETSSILPTLPTSTTSPTARRTRRTSTTSVAGRGRRQSVPARRWRGQRHLPRTRVARKQKTTEAQRLTNTGGNHQCSCPLSVVRTPDHLYSGGSVAQLRSSGQVPSPRRSGDPREQGKEGIGGRGRQHQHHLPPETLRLGSCTQRAPRVRYSFLRHCADRRRIPAWTHLHACHLWNSRKLQNRIPEVRGGKFRLRI
jgi:hypothetical protein